MRGRVVAVCALALASAACPPKKAAPTNADASPTPSASSSSDLAPQATKLVVGLDPSRSLEGCTALDEGLLIDFGGSALSHLERATREGETWARVDVRELDVPFLATSADSERPIDHVQLHARLLAAKSLEVFVNGRRIGRISQKDGELATLPLPSRDLHVHPGTNRLLLRFLGAEKVRTLPLGEMAWVHLGTSAPSPNYHAPTRSYLLGERTIRGTARRTVSLRPGGALRCVAWLPRGAVFRYEAVPNGGEGELTVRVHSDRTGPKELLRVPVRGAGISGEPKLGGAGDEAAIIEIAASASGVGRISLVEPVLAVPASSNGEPHEPARSALVVFAGFIAPHALKPFGGPTELASIEGLARSGTVFENHYATTNFANGSVAAALSGRPAADIRMTDGTSRIPDGTLTLSAATSAAGFVTGLFTANPTTFGSFGFDAGWTERLELPLGDPATTVYAKAADFVRNAKGKRFFAVVHARGAHPPWDATATELKGLAPSDYAGAIDPRHAGDTLARARHVPPLLRLSDADRARLAALEAHVLAAEDRALAQLLEAVRTTEPRTLVIFAGDVGPNASQVAPFAEGMQLNEGVRRIPLIVKWPEGTSLRETQPTMDYDLGRTVLEGLGLTAPANYVGENVGTSSDGRVFRAITATSKERRLTQLGSFVLEERRGTDRLCDLHLDPDCLTDLAATYPYTLELLALASRKALPKEVAKREAARIGAKEALDLLAWGRDEP